MTQWTVCLIPGDGVGKEVIPVAAEILAGLGLGLTFTEADAGFEYFQRAGDAIPDRTLADIRSAGVALFGATSSPTTGAVAGYRSPILAMRKAFDLYANLRPVQSLPGPFSRAGLDLLIVRENTEGLYSGRERREGDTAIAERVITARGSERIARAAFDQARRRAYKPGHPLGSTVTVVHKANVLKVTDGLFREQALKVAAEYPEVQVTEMLVDSMAMRLVKDPEKFDILVTTNLFGDILSDEASALIGGLGVAPSANIGAETAVFEPVHGSAPDIAGRGIANPIGAILSAAMLLDYIGQEPAAGRVRAAVNATLQAGILPKDLGGNATTADVKRSVLRHL